MRKIYEIPEIEVINTVDVVVTSGEVESEKFPVGSNGEEGYELG